MMKNIAIAFSFILSGCVANAMVYQPHSTVATNSSTPNQKVSAQNVCSSYIEKTVEPLNANILWKNLAGVPTVKDEYETTVAFEDRVADAMSLITSPTIVEIPIQRKYIKYDADLSRLDIQKYAFSNHTTDYGGVFGYGTPHYNKIEYSSFDNIHVVFPYEESQSGSYVGTNAMGVQIRVKKLNRSTKAIFERKGKYGEDLFPSLIRHDEPVMSFEEVTPDKAKSVKRTARAAIVYIPKAPYFAKGKFYWGKPTIKRPTDIDEKIEVAIGDIQCALFLDESGKVYGAVSTR